MFLQGKLESGIVEIINETIHQSAFSSGEILYREIYEFIVHSEQFQ